MATTAAATPVRAGAPVVEVMAGVSFLRAVAPDAASVSAPQTPLVGRYAYEVGLDTPLAWRLALGAMLTSKSYT